MLRSFMYWTIAFFLIVKGTVVPIESIISPGTNMPRWRERVPRNSVMQVDIKFNVRLNY